MLLASPLMLNFCVGRVRKSCGVLADCRCEVTVGTKLEGHALRLLTVVLTDLMVRKIDAGDGTDTLLAFQWHGEPVDIFGPWYELDCGDFQMGTLTKRRGADTVVGGEKVLTRSVTSTASNLSIRVMRFWLILSVRASSSNLSSAALWMMLVNSLALNRRRPRITMSAQERNRDKHHSPCTGIIGEMEIQYRPTLIANSR